MGVIVSRRLMLHVPRDLRLVPWTVPEPDAGQVLVQTTCSAVSVASELGLVVGREQLIAYPHTLGHQSVGRVLAVGAGVANLRPGNRVVGFWEHARSPDARSRDRIRLAIQVTFGPRSPRAGVPRSRTHPSALWVA